MISLSFGKPNVLHKLFDDGRRVHELVSVETTFCDITMRISLQSRGHGQSYGDIMAWNHF